MLWGKLRQEGKVGREGLSREGREGLGATSGSLCCGAGMQGEEQGERLGGRCSGPGTDGSEMECERKKSPRRIQGSLALTLGSCQPRSLPPQPPPPAPRMYLMIFPLGPEEGVRLGESG